MTGVWKASLSMCAVIALVERVLNNQEQKTYNKWLNSFQIILIVFMTVLFEAKLVWYLNQMNNIYCVILFGKTYLLQAIDAMKFEMVN